MRVRLRNVQEKLLFNQQFCNKGIYVIIKIHVIIKQDIIVIIYVFETHMTSNVESSLLLVEQCLTCTLIYMKFNETVSVHNRN